MPETPDLERRRFFGASAATVAASTLGLQFISSDRSKAMSAVVQQAGGDTAIRPFKANFSDAELADLRKRVLATRFPE